MRIISISYYLVLCYRFTFDAQIEAIKVSINHFDRTYSINAVNVNAISSHEYHNNNYDNTGNITKCNDYDCGICNNYMRVS